MRHRIAGRKLGRTGAHRLALMRNLSTALLDKEKAKVLRELKDLELERESGAIEETEYQELRQSYLTDAALVNRRISALRRDAGPPVRGTDSESTGEAASPRKEIAETSEGRPS